jgi:hypothetical protein
METRGGKREGSGRKPLLDKKQTITIYVETSKVDEFGGKENLKRELYKYIKWKH